MRKTIILWIGLAVGLASLLIVSYIVAEIGRIEAYKLPISCDEGPVDPSFPCSPFVPVINIINSPPLPPPPDQIPTSIPTAQIAQKLVGIVEIMRWAKAIAKENEVYLESLRKLRKSITKNDWEDVFPNQRIFTINPGEAIIRIARGCEIHLFFDGELQKSYCSRDAKPEEKALCLIRGAFTFWDNNCNSKVVVEAGGNYLRNKGTLYAMSYVPDPNDPSKLNLIVIAYQGKVIANPEDIFIAPTKRETEIELDSNTTNSGPNLRPGKLWFQTSDDVTFGGCKAGEICDFPQPWSPETERFNTLFQIEKWLPRGIEIFISSANQDDGIPDPTPGDNNPQRFPFKPPTTTLSENKLPFGKLQIEGNGESKKIQVINQSKLILNLVLEDQKPYIMENGNKLELQPYLSDPLQFEVTLSNNNKLRISFDDGCKYVNTDDKERNCFVSVTYLPTTTGELNAHLILRHNADAKGKFDPIELTGEAVPAPTISISPSPFEPPFGKQKVGTESEARIITVRATNESNPTIKKVSIIDTNGSEDKNFKIEENFCTGQTLSIEKGQEKDCKFKVIFNPQSVDNHFAKILVEEETGAEASVPLSGEGIPPDPDVVKVSIQNKTFLPEKINGKSDPEEITISVMGPNPVEIGEISVGGKDAGTFKVTENACSGRTITKDKPCTIKVVFNPKTKGQHSAEVTIKNEVLSLDGKESFPGLTKKVSLSGYVIEADPESSCFTEREKKVERESVEPRAYREIVIKKPGDSNGIITDLKIVTESNVESRDFTIENREDCIGKSGPTCTVRIGFTPRKRRVRSATLLVYYESSKPESIRVRTAGVGKSRNWFLRFFFDTKDWITRKEDERCPF